MKKIISLFLLTAMLLMPAAPVFAAEQLVNDADPHSLGVTVSAQVVSNFYVSIPADFALESQATPKVYNTNSYNFFKEYSIGVKGNIASNKVVSVTPSTLTLVDSADAGNTISVVINQPKTTFSRADLCTADVPKAAYTTTSGYTYANIDRAGIYSGTLTFTFRLTDAE